MTDDSQGPQHRWFVRGDLDGFFGLAVDNLIQFLLILGLFTRPVAAAMVALFAIITFVYLGQDPFIAKEKAFVFLMMSIYVFWAGPGTWSVDHLLFRKTAAPEPAAR